MLALLFEPEGSEEEQMPYEYDDERVPYDLPSNVASRFADYLLGFPDSGMRIFADQLREGCDAAPAFVDYLLMHIAASMEKIGSKERYWVVWDELSEKAQSIAVQLAASNPWTGRRDDGRKLIRGMLAADIEWQRVDYESQDIALGKEQILEFAANAGMNPDVFESLTSLMYHFPSIFFESGIRTLSRHMEEGSPAGLLEGVNTKYHLERSVQHFLRIDETGPLPREMHKVCLEALSTFVESGSSRAYFLREHLIHSRRTL